MARWLRVLCGVITVGVGVCASRLPPPVRACVRVYVRVRTLLRLQNKNFHLWYTLDRPPQGWKYATGFVNETMVKEHLPAASSDTLVLMCGPPPMLKHACIPALESLGHSADNYFCF